MPKVFLPHDYYKDGNRLPATEYLENLNAIVDVVNALDAENMSEGSVTDEVIGERTIDQAETPTGHTGLLTALLGWVANRIKAITGKANWYNDPDITLAATKAHVDANTGVHGVGGSAVESVAGAQAKAAAAENAAKAYTDTHEQKAAPHSGHASADALAGHVGDKENPHEVTAEQVGAISAGELAAHINDDENPHSVSAEQVGAPVSVDGVSNAGGNIDLVAGVGIAITSNPETKKIQFDATGEATPGPHAASHEGGSDPVSPGGIGAAKQTDFSAHLTASTPHRYGLFAWQYNSQDQSLDLVVIE